MKLNKRDRLKAEELLTHYKHGLAKLAREWVASAPELIREDVYMAAGVRRAAEDNARSAGADEDFAELDSPHGIEALRVEIAKLMKGA